jgi:hypothetical protein
VKHDRLAVVDDTVAEDVSNDVLLLPRVLNPDLLT